MKYIRTKDGRIITLKDELMGQPELWVLGGKENILKIADTIEELCDEFVFLSYDNHCIIRSLEIPKRYKESYADITYGAIWTDKGLIYVAKMNEEGCLELL